MERPSSPSEANRHAEDEEDEDETTRWMFPSISHWLESLPNHQALATASLLIFVNFINYMDRSILAGMTSFVKKDPSFHFSQEDDKYLGFLQSAFVFGYMTTAPFFGFWGDRKSRKILLLIGITFWSFATLFGSFMQNYWLFILFRGLVGIGEASYSTVAPAILSDLFSKDVRSRALALFYFAIPVGTGLGYMVGANVAAASGNWRWGMRVTPFLGFLAVLLIVFFMIDPPRGESEGANMHASSTKEDIHALLKNKSFKYLTCGFTCVTFCAGALMWWGPRFAFLGAKIACGDRIGCQNIEPGTISYRFGIVMTFAGIVGVPGGSYISQLLRQRFENADPLVCGFTLLASVPVLFFGLISAQYNIGLCYGLTFIAGLLLNCNWSIVSDMTLYIVIPTRRSFASACQILMSHLLGDAFSPFLIGFLADAMQPIIRENGNAITSIFFQGRPVSETPSAFEDDTANFVALQYSLFSCCFFQIAGAFFFLYLSFYILDDKMKACREVCVNKDDSEVVPIIRDSDSNCASTMRPEEEEVHR
ncbi:protein spinster [Lepeophtheirus salmonis]|uniref:Major facilitator superfamily (MFS) profile domain-containing protein n=1 Tax=Lepeophtheirus salmonis TaxID=72036 RepID=A0A0K2V5W4_LEPSM|nr:protein spinster-like [Lepeophtheirus salmonis]